MLHVLLEARVQVADHGAQPDHRLAVQVDDEAEHPSRKESRVNANHRVAAGTGRLRDQLHHRRDEVGPDVAVSVRPAGRLLEQIVLSACQQREGCVPRIPIDRAAHLHDLVAIHRLPDAAEAAAFITGALKECLVVRRHETIGDGAPHRAAVLEAHVIPLLRGDDIHVRPPGEQDHRFNPAALMTPLRLPAAPLRNEDHAGAWRGAGRVAAVEVGADRDPGDRSDVCARAGVDINDPSCRVDPERRSLRGRPMAWRDHSPEGADLTRRIEVVDRRLMGQVVVAQHIQPHGAGAGIQHHRSAGGSPARACRPASGRAVQRWCVRLEADAKPSVLRRAIAHPFVKQRLPCRASTKSRKWTRLVASRSSATTV